MKKLTKTFLLIVLSFCMVLSGATAITFAQDATAITYQNVSYSLQEQPRLRVESDEHGTGLTFLVSIPKAEFEALEGKENITFGVLVAKKSSVDQFPLTAQNVFYDGAYVINGKAEAGKPSLAQFEMSAENFFADEDIYYHKATLKNISTNLATCEFVGVAYIKYDLDGIQQYVFKNSACASTSYTAQKVLEDKTKVDAILGG